MLDTVNAPEPRTSAALSDAEQVKQWLGQFERGLMNADRTALENLFTANAHWRDLFALTWNLTPTNGREAIVQTLLQHQPQAKTRAFCLAKGHSAPQRVKRTGVDVIEAFYQFETESCHCLGVLRLSLTDPGKAWVLSTTLHTLKGHAPAVGSLRPEGTTQRVFGGQAWAKQREAEQRYDDREPTVLVVGGGHNGLALSARLRLLGVDALVVERLPRVGDVWRKRYSALALHNEIQLNHLPHMPFPDSWPKYLPKDMLGDWLESYACAMGCNVWTGTSFVDARYDAASQTWSARVRRDDGSERVLHPRHLVFANGVVGEPRMPDAPGLSEFAGELIHAQGFDSGAPWRGKKVLVLGVGNSAHDIAQDLEAHGAQVTMIQRGAITVFSVKAASMNHAIYYNSGLPLEECDLVATCSTFPLLLRGYQLNTQRMLEMDQDLLAGLKARGFKLDVGDDGGGHQMKVRKQHGGYYLNVGGSDLIVNGQIGLLHYEDIDRFVPAGVRMKDGQVHAADLIVAATGYHSPTDVIRQMLGEEITAKIGPVWGMDAGGEMANMYKPTAQEGLWFTGGGFAQGRVWSHYLALQIKARELGIAK
jgi:hypothetical protein